MPVSTKKATTKKKTPVWRGPTVDGITQSLLSRFLVDRERFRLLVVEGLKPAEGFSHRIGYGNMWHVCEEALAAGVNWDKPLAAYCKTLCTEFHTQQDEIAKWYCCCKTQFPIYVDYWQHHPDVKQRTPIFQEKVFSVLYELPTSRTVLLNGKWDSVDIIGSGKTAGIYLQENKSKGDINENQLKRQLTFDLQTMIYLIALQTLHKQFKLGDRPILGVRYNVVRRPLSGGRGTIKQLENVNRGKKGSDGKKPVPRPETSDEFYRRLGDLIASATGPDWGCRPGDSYFFMRWKCEVNPHDINRFRCECLDPILEQLCDWWQWIVKSSGRSPFSPDDGCDNELYREVQSSIHYRMPYGIYNPLLEGNPTDLDEYLHSGSEIGLQRVTNLFPELT